MAIMNNAYEDFASGSQSPYNVGRGAHPGAVLLSPQSSAMNLSNSATSTGVLSPLLSSQSHSLSFNEMLDQQSLMLDPSAQHQSQVQQPMQQSNSMTTAHSAAGSAVMSPMIQSPSRTPANIPTTSMFLDSFSRPSNNSMLGMHSRSQSSNKPQSQLKSQTQAPAAKQSQQRNQSEANPVVNFTQDINQLCSWMSMLSSSQQNTVMDNLLSTLNEDVLQYTKLKLDSLMNSGYLSPQVPAIASPVPNRETYSITNLDSVFSNGDRLENKKDSGNPPMIDNSVIYQQWSPQPTSMTQPIYDYIKDMNQRPKSADPNVSRATAGHKTKKPLMSTNSHNHTFSHNNYYPSSVKSRNTNSEFDGGSSNGSAHISYSNRQQNNSNSHASINIHTVQTPVTSPTSPSNGSSSNTSANPPTPPVTVSNNGGGHGSSMNPKTLTDPRLLTNIPVWLKSLRLHKYSDALSSKKWDELIYLDDETLEKMGISALGARRKLLKAFAIVKDYKEHGLIDQTAYVQ